jgi:hypothetical protein
MLSDIRLLPIDLYCRKVGFWRFIGIGFVGLGLGAAFGLDFWIPYITRNSDNMNVLSSAFLRRFEVRLRATAEGTVKLESMKFTLQKDKQFRWTIILVFFGPGAKVIANGELTVRAPSFLPQETSQRPHQRFRNYKLYGVQKVPFEKGVVWTGWKFLMSVQKYPTDQYCYYLEGSKQSIAEAIVSVGKDQKLETICERARRFRHDGRF